jgi:hypothetical protein
LKYCCIITAAQGDFAPNRGLFIQFADYEFFSMGREIFFRDEGIASNIEVPLKQQR